MCELLVGLPDINVLGVVDEVDEVLQVHVETRVDRSGCGRCGVVARVKERPVVVLVDLPCFRRPTGPLGVEKAKVDLSGLRLCSQVVYREERPGRGLVDQTGGRRDLPEGRPGGLLGGPGGPSSAWAGSVR